MIFDIINQNNAKDNKNWQIFENKKTPVKEITGKYLKTRLGVWGEVTRKKLWCSQPSFPYEKQKFNINKLKKMGLVAHIGPARGGYWKLLID